MIRVLLLSNSFTPNNDALFAEVARRETIDLQVAYCTWREPHRLWHLPPTKGYAYTVMSGWSFGVSTHVNPGVVSLVLRARPDVAVLTGSYTMPTFHLAAATLWATRVPWVYWGEELQYDHVGLARSIGRAMLRRPLRGAEGVLAIGRRAADSYARTGVPRERIAIFHYYADTRSFQLAPDVRGERRASIRAGLGIGELEVVFISSAQLIPRKGVDVILRASAALHERNIPHRLIVAGDGPQRRALEAQADSLGIARSTHFAGFVQPDELPDWFAASDALVLASRQEGWGLVVPEALAAGLPVIATDRVNAAIELIEPGRSGQLVPVDDVDALAGAMQRVARADAAHRECMARAARNAVRGETPERAAMKLEHLLMAVADGRTIGHP